MLNLNGVLNVDKQRVEMKLPIIYFKDENEIEILYCPSLELSGYGKSYDEAKESLKIVIAEFFTYIIHKRTITKVLNELGWNKRKHGFIPPLNSELIQRDELYHDIVNNKPYQMLYEEIAI